MNFSPDNFLKVLKEIVTGVNGPVKFQDNVGLIQGVSGTQIADDGGFNKDIVLPLTALTFGTASALVDNTGGTASNTLGTITTTFSNTQVGNAIASLAKAINILGANVAALTTTALVLKVPAGQTYIGTIPFQIPRDYDEASDQLVFSVIADQLAQVTDTNVALSVTPSVLLYQGTISNKSAVNGTVPFATATTAFVLTTKQQRIEFNLSGYGLKRDALIYIALNTNGNNATAGDNVEIFGSEITYASTLVSYNESDATGVDGSLQEEGNPLR